MTSAPFGLQNAPQVGERAIADVVEDEVVALARSREILLRVVDHVVGAERAHQLDVARAADAGDFGAEVLGDLHGECADAARCAVDQHLLSRLDAAMVAQALQRGELPRRPRQPACSKVTLAGLSATPRRLANDDVLGEGAVRAAEHFIAGLEARDVLADGFDRAGEVDADASVLRRAETG